MKKHFPLFVCVFLGYLTIQSAATLASRHFSGVICDTRGSSIAVRYGVVLSVLAG